MKSYKITEKQLKMIIEQVDDEQKDKGKEEDPNLNFFGGDDNEETNGNGELPSDDPIQQLFNSLV